VFGKGLGLYALWASIGLIAYVYSLSRSTTVYCMSIVLLTSILAERSDVPFATSSFGEHTIIGTIGVINGVLNGVSQPFIAKVHLIISSMRICAERSDCRHVVSTSYSLARCHPVRRRLRHVRWCSERYYLCRWSTHLHPRKLRDHFP
jgi:hypothetical protein